MTDTGGRSARLDALPDRLRALLGQEYRTHATLTQPVQDAVAANLVTGAQVNPGVVVLDRGSQFGGDRGP